MFIAQLPQIPSLQLRLSVSVGSCYNEKEAAAISTLNVAESKVTPMLDGT
jgi:hypothetical protein